MKELFGFIVLIFIYEVIRWLIINAVDDATKK